MAWLRDFEVKFCDDILRYGTILSDEEYTSVEGFAVRTFTIEYEGVRYVLNKLNGEWNNIRRVYK